VKRALTQQWKKSEQLADASGACSWAPFFLPESVLAEKQQVTAEQGWHSDQEKTTIGLNLFFRKGCQPRLLDLALKGMPRACLFRYISEGETELWTIKMFWPKQKKIV
jgi:hypothetical protein